MIEKKIVCYIKILIIDRSNKFTFNDFNRFYKNQGIKRQLTTTYTKNKTIMNIHSEEYNEK